MALVEQLWCPVDPQTGMPDDRWENSYSPQSGPHAATPQALDLAASPHRRRDASPRTTGPSTFTVRNTFIEVDEDDGSASDQETLHSGAASPLRGRAGSAQVRCASEPLRGARRAAKASGSELASQEQDSMPAVQENQFVAHHFTSFASAQDVYGQWDYLSAEGMESDGAWQGGAGLGYDCPLNSQYADWVSAQSPQDQMFDCGDGGAVASSIGVPFAGDSYGGHGWHMAVMPEHNPCSNEWGNFSHLPPTDDWSQQHFHDFPDMMPPRPPGQNDLADAMQASFHAGMATGMTVHDGDSGSWHSSSGALCAGDYGHGGPLQLSARNRRASRRKDFCQPAGIGWACREPTASERSTREATPRPSWSKTPPTGSDCETSTTAASWHENQAIHAAQPIPGRSADRQVIWCDPRAFKASSEAMRKELEDRTQTPAKAYKSAERCIRLLRKKQHAQGRPQCVFLISWSNAPALVPFLATVPHVVAHVVLLVDMCRTCRHGAADRLARLFPIVTAVAQTWAEALDAVAAAVKDSQSSQMIQDSHSQWT